MGERMQISLFLARPGPVASVVRTSHGSQLNHFINVFVFDGGPFAVLHVWQLAPRTPANVSGTWRKRVGEISSWSPKPSLSLRLVLDPSSTSETAGLPSVSYWQFLSSKPRLRSVELICTLITKALFARPSWNSPSLFQPVEIICFN